MKRLLHAFLAALLAFAPVAQADLRASSGAFGPIAATSGTVSTAVTGLPTLLSLSFAAVSAPADTNEDTLSTITVPGNTLGANGCLRITTLWTVTNSVNNKILRIRYSGIGGTQYLVSTLTASASAGDIRTICNRNATNSQVGPPAIFSGPITNTTSANVTSAVDTTASTTVVATCQKATAGETCTLEGIIAEVIH